MSRIAQEATSRNGVSQGDKAREARQSAPKYQVSSKPGLAAVEHPMIVMDVDKGIQSFGKKSHFPAVSALTGNITGASLIQLRL